MTATFDKHIARSVRSLSSFIKTFHWSRLFYFSVQCALLVFRSIGAFTDFGPRSISLQTSSPNVAKDVNKNKDLIVSLYTRLQFCILCSNFVHSAPILYTQPRFCMLSPDFVYSDPIVCTWLH